MTTTGREITIGRVQWEHGGYQSVEVFRTDGLIGWLTRERYAGWEASPELGEYFGWPPQLSGHNDVRKAVAAMNKLPKPVASHRHRALMDAALAGINAAAEVELR